MERYGIIRSNPPLSAHKLRFASPFLQEVGTCCKVSDGESVDSSTLFFCFKNLLGWGGAARAGV